LNREDCREILNCPDEDFLILLAQAYQVRRKYFGKIVHIQVLRNAKSGICSEDCHYCSQSRVSNAEIDRFPLISKETLLADARVAKNINADRFCISTSGTRPDEDEIEKLCEAISAIKAESELPLCATLGLITDNQAKKLKAAGLDRVNHNLNTSRRYYSRICTTHTFQDRLDTITTCKQAGLEICCGGIFGQGENSEDIIDLMLTLKEIQPQAVPVNFLVPIKGTPFETIDNHLNPQKCLKILCLARFITPRSEIRAAGGWEYNLRQLKPLALFAADSIFVQGYLTTGGISISEARDMVADLGFESAIDADIDDTNAFDTQ
jgi:biotin synthase